ncbi:acyltransferase family protein [Chitinophagaceae bacterium MMS25-I14]
MSITKLPGLNGLRALSILLVVCCHLGIEYHTVDYLSKIKIIDPFIGLLQDGYLGVNIFFVISGFLITTILVAEEQQTGTISLKNFYARRFLRIFPAYYFLLLVYFIFQLLGWIHLSGYSWLTSFTYTKYLNWKLDWYTAHTWSLSVEEQFYLLWPFIFLLKDKPRKVITISLIVMAPAIRWYIHYHPVWWISELSFFTRIDAICTGCFIALYKDSILSLNTRYWKLLFYSAVVCLFFLRYLPVLTDGTQLDFIWISFGTTYGTIANILIGWIIVYTAYGPQGLWFRVLNNHVLNYLGVLSYSIYLWQEIFTINRDHWFGRLPLNLVCIFIAAILSYYCIERPFLKLKSKFQ